MFVLTLIVLIRRTWKLQRAYKIYDLDTQGVMATLVSAGTNILLKTYGLKRMDSGIVENAMLQMQPTVEKG